MSNQDTMGQLFRQGLTQTAVIRKQWASRILFKKAVFILKKKHSSTAGFWSSWHC